MTSRALLLLVSLSFASSASEAQDADHRSDAEGVFFQRGTPVQIFSDQPEAEFFRILRSTHVREYPFTFEEAVETATVIGRGHFVAVLPGRTIQNARRPDMSPISTVLIKVQATSVQKGEPKGYFYVEYPLHWSNLPRLKGTLYRGEVLFMLGPPMEFYHPFTVDEVMSEEATAEVRDEAIHSLSVEAGLFTMSRAGQLTSAIDFSQDFGDLYSRIRSLDELAALIEREVSLD